MRFPQNLLRVYDMLRKYHHHHFGICFIIFHRKISRMDRNHFMIHLCTFTTLMLLQNNISQKILFIATRTIQFPGFVFKVCIDLIVAIVTSSIYFDVQKFSYLFENIYISNLLYNRSTSMVGPSCWEGTLVLDLVNSWSGTWYYHCFLPISAVHGPLVE